MPADFFYMPRGFYAEGGLTVPSVGRFVAVIGTLMTRQALIEDIASLGGGGGVAEGEGLVVIPEEVFAFAARDYVTRYGLLPPG